MPVLTSLFVVVFTVMQLVSSSELSLHSFRRDVSQVTSDITAISSKLTTLDNDVKAFPGSSDESLTQALGIHADFTTLAPALTTGTADTTASPNFSQTDGLTVLTALLPIVSAIDDATSNFVQKKTAFASLILPCFPALILADLQSLNSSMGSFISALGAKEPADLAPLFQCTTSPIFSALNAAISTYQS